MTEPAVTTSPPPALPRGFRRKRIVSAILLSLVVFASGAAVGWGVTRLMGPRGMHNDGMRPDPPVPAMVDRLREELMLNADQSKQVEEIYKARFDTLKQIRDEMAPRMRAEYDKLREQMKGVLTPAQFERWDQRFNSVRNRMLPPPRRAGGESDRAGPGEQPQDGPPRQQPRPRLEGPPEGPPDRPPPPMGGPRDGMPPRNGPFPGGPA